MSKYEVFLEHIDDEDDVVVISGKTKNELIDNLINFMYRNGWYEVGDWQTN